MGKQPFDELNPYYFKPLKWWMRIVGSFYVLLFIGTTILKMPVRILAPEGTLDNAAAGEAVSSLLVDTWVTIGLALLSIGISLLVASGFGVRAIGLGWTVIIFETVWGLGSDIYQISRGHPMMIITIWILIHLVIITAGILALLKANKVYSLHRKNIGIFIN